MTAESVSASHTTNRNCTIEINNFSKNFCLVNPLVYMSSGYCSHPPQPTVRPTMTEVCSFTKDDDTATGAVGLLTYDLFQMHNSMCSERVAIMFSVPFDYILYKNWFGVGVFDVNHACDNDLYKKMYYDNDFAKFNRSEAVGSGIEYKTAQVNLRATMSNVAKAIVKVELYDESYQWQ